ncbi:MAG: hemolysin family protein [Oscillospiraceae bacterium]|nr:hemolysin family protein [Oscillospiraceae bacterium]
MEWWRIIVIVLLTILSGFFAASEIAITGVNRIRLKYKAEKGSKAAAKALKLLNKYDKSLITLLIGNNVVMLIAASMATLVAINIADIAGWDETMVVAVVTAVITVALLVLSEILPKTLAYEHSDRFVIVTAGVLTVFVWCLTPVSLVLLLIQNAARKVFRKSEKAVSVTEQELLQIIDEIEDEGVLEGQESNLVRSALEFDETTLEEIITPRVDITAASLNDSADKVRDIFFEEGYSRLPVYDGTLDKIVGIISSKDFMKWLLAPPESRPAEMPVADIVRLPALMKLSDAFKFMQSQKSHMAVVLDQYGGTAGIVTLEDILEELVGEIWDEGDEEVRPVKFINARVFEVGSELSVNNFNRFFEGYEPEENAALYSQLEIVSESNSVGGWVFELFGRIPAQGESAMSELFKVTVLTMEGRRPGRLKFEILERAEIRGGM